MSVRNCKELGVHLQQIINRLLANDNLVNLLYYEDKDPLSKTKLNQEEKRKLFEKLIKVVPKVDKDETSKSVVVLYIENGQKDSSNEEFRNISLKVDVLVPFSQWIIKDSNLRPFAILGEIQSSLDGKIINGLGGLIAGDFGIKFLTDEMSCYTQDFIITEYA